LPSSIKLAILDYDLTLMNNALDFYIAFVNALSELCDRKTSFEEFYYLLGEDALDTIIPFDVDRRLMWERTRTHICKSHVLIPNWGVKYFLQTARHLGVKVVVLTGRMCHPKHIIMDLEKSGLDDYISEVYTFYDLYVLGGVEETLHDKTWMLKYIVTKHGVEPQEAVFIADYELDYYSSVKAGLEFIAYLGHKSRYEKFKRLGVKYIARDFYEATIFLIELAGKKLR